jgi:hypothetical protein
VNKLKFNLKKREFTLLGLSLSLLALRFPPSSVPLSFLRPRPHDNQPQHRTIADRIFISSPSTIASLHQLIGTNRPHRLVSTLRQRPLSWTSNFKFLKRSNHRLKRSALSLSLPSSAVDSKHFVRTGEFFWNCQWASERQMMTTWLLFNWNQRDGMPLLVRSHPALKNQGGKLLCCCYCRSSVLYTLLKCKLTLWLFVYFTVHPLSRVFFVDPCHWSLPACGCTART